MLNIIKILVVIFTCLSVSYAKTTATFTNEIPYVGQDVVLMCVTQPIGRYPVFGHVKKSGSNSPPIALTDRDVVVVDDTSGRYSLRVYQNRNELTGTENYNLTIRNVNIGDSGCYGCFYKSRTNDIDEEDFTELIVRERKC